MCFSELQQIDSEIVIFSLTGYIGAWIQDSILRGRVLMMKWNNKLTGTDGEHKPNMETEWILNTSDKLRQTGGLWRVETGVDNGVNEERHVEWINWLPGGSGWRRIN